MSTHWKYLALTRVGGEVRGNEMGDKKEIIQKIEEKDLTIISLRRDIRCEIKQFFLKKKLSYNILASFFDDFSEMVDSGLDTIQIIDILLSTIKGSKIKIVLLELKNSLTLGSSLSESMKKTKSFSNLDCCIIDIGERSGSLLKVMQYLSEYYYYSNKLRSELIRSMIYPIIIFVLLNGLLIGCVKFLVPKIEHNFSTDLSNSFPTNIIITFVDIVAGHWYNSVIFIGICILFKIFISTIEETKKEQWIKNIVKIVPLLGRYVKEKAIAIFFINLTVIVKSGISLSQGLDLMKDSMSIFIKKDILKCIELIKFGYTFANALEQVNLVSLDIIHMIKKGEEQGKLHLYLDKLSQKQKNSLNKKTKTFFSIITPMMMVICFIVVAILIVGIIFPIYDKMYNMNF